MLGGVIETPINFAKLNSTVGEGPGGWASTFGDTRSWSIGSALQREVDGGGLNFGDFADAAFDFLGQQDGQGRPSDEFYVPPQSTEYDLSIDTGSRTTTFTIYDRWNGIADVYIFGDGNSAHLEVPLDNSDFSSSGQFTGQNNSGFDFDFI